MKFNLVDTIVVVFIVGLIGSNIYFYKKSKSNLRDKDSLQLVVDSLSREITEDSLLISKLDELNTSCNNTAMEKVKYYEKKINAIYNNLDKNRQVINDLQNKKDQINSDSWDNLLDYINKNY